MLLTKLETIYNIFHRYLKSLPLIGSEVVRIENYCSKVANLRLIMQSPIRNKLRHLMPALSNDRRLFKLRTSLYPYYSDPISISFIALFHNNRIDLKITYFVQSHAFPKKKQYLFKKRCDLVIKMYLKML